MKNWLEGNLNLNEEIKSKEMVLMVQTPTFP